MKKLSYLGMLLCLANFTTSCDYNKRENYQGKSNEEQVSENQTAEKKEAQKQEVSKFIIEAANSNLAAIHLGKMAIEKATSREVKEFAKNMLDEHNKINEDLQRMAEKNNVTYPTTPTDKDQDMVRELSKEIGYDFDKKFMKKMVEAHKNQVDMFEKASKDLENIELKNYASNTLPTLRNNLMKAEQNEDLVQNRKDQIRKKEKSM